MEMHVTYCCVCHWSYTIPVIVGPASNDYKRMGDEMLDKHMRNDHGLMSVLKHEHELSQAIIKATRDGERRGRLEIRDEMKNATLEAMREIGRSL